jgi:hypothetical protein
MARSALQRLMDAVNNVAYPTNVDWFYEVQDGSKPLNTIWADYTNKLTRTIGEVQKHVQYTATSPNPTGALIHTIVYEEVLRRPLRRDLLTVALTVDPQVAQSYFGGNPFARRYGLMVSAACFKYTSTGKEYTPVRAAVNVGRELGNLTALVNASIDRDWYRGDHLETVLTIIRP